MSAKPETMAVPHLANRDAGVFQFAGLVLSRTHQDAFATAMRSSKKLHVEHIGSVI